MKFVILDVYPDKKHRLVKDTAGGYTGNDFGGLLFSKFLIYMLIKVLECQQLKL